MSLNGAPGAVGRGCEWRAQVRLVRAVRGNLCIQDDDAEELKLKWLTGTGNKKNKEIL